MTDWVVVGAIAAWAWGWGYWCHESRRFEMVLAIGWPILIPLGKLIHWWDWGKNNHLIRYSDMEWWQRGLKERRTRSGGSEP